MKNSCAVGFFKGSLLKDEDGLLVQPGKHSQAMRRLHFESPEEIEDGEDTIRRFIDKAIQAEKDGLEVAFTEKDNLDYPDELQDALDDDPELAEAFEELTPGRQRGWVLHFSDAKQSETRARRIEKAHSKIIGGKGWDER
ncbi:YdeI/OmpD-associated family protein [Sulfitobacter maritimus]|uniref:YdeI/OmpD-associated family protein n=1 Tax=Sulfitobacter maritimus TaxID=2741719 RepID=UPI001C2ED194|nr:YdeI/OmpD-associated family protein [Sulfitobacter maritimus]